MKTVEEADLLMKSIKIGDLIEFNRHSVEVKKLIGTVTHDEGLGLITIVDGVKYELRKLMDIEVL